MMCYSLLTRIDIVIFVISIPPMDVDIKYIDHYNHHQFHLLLNLSKSAPVALHAT